MFDSQPTAPRDDGLTELRSLDTGLANGEPDLHRWLEDYRIEPVPPVRSWST